MTIWLLAIHIAVLGYWLGSELVINSTFRHVCFADAMPMADRNRLLDHVVHADQHVRYALVLQASLGASLAALSGYVPGGEGLVWALLAAGALWLALIRHFRIWARMLADGPTPADEAGIRRLYTVATAILGVLWLCIAGIAMLSVGKPF